MVFRVTWKTGHFSFHSCALMCAVLFLFQKRYIYIYRSGQSLHSNTCRACPFLCILPAFWTVLSFVGAEFDKCSVAAKIYRTFEICVLSILFCFFLFLLSLSLSVTQCHTTTPHIIYWSLAFDGCLVLFHAVWCWYCCWCRGEEVGKHCKAFIKSKANVNVENKTINIVIISCFVTENC